MRPHKMIILGVAAAIASAGLAYLLQGLLGGPRQDSGEAGMGLRCVVAVRDLPAGHRIAGSDVESVDLVGQSGGDVVTNPALAIGRATAGLVSKGQAIRASDLVAPGSGSSIAAQLGTGMRAMTVTLRETGPEVALYPGAVVDVLATIERPGRAAGQRDSITLTLLQRVRVLAVNDDAVGARPARENAGERPTASRKLNVTLAVTPEQAAKVELASSRGTIGITLRSGDDVSDHAPDGATATAWSLLGLPEAPSEPPPPAGQRQSAAASAADAKPAPAPAVTAPEAKPPAPVWQVTVMRGEVTSTHTLPDPNADAQARNPRTP